MLKKLGINRIALRRQAGDLLRNVKVVLYWVLGLPPSMAKQVDGVWFCQAGSRARECTRFCSREESHTSICINEHAGSCKATWKCRN